MKRVELRSARFRLEREKRWRELEALVAKVGGKGVRALEPDEAARLPGLYRAALASLSVARAITLDKNVIDYLTSLCSRAFLVVYGTRHRFFSSVAAFFTRHFPAAARRSAGPMLVGATLLALGGVVGYAVTAHDPERYFSFVPRELASGRTPWSETEELRRGLYSTTDDGLAHFASFLFSHNSQVVFLCFALGAAIGLPVVYLLFLNGAVLGAMSQVFHAHGLGADWWGWILPHGVTELLAVVLGGAGGLAFGRAIVFPGRMRRLDALVAAGRDAGTLALGAMAMLAFAAIVEGFLRQLVTAIEVRYALAAATCVFWAVYFAIAGRGARGEREAAA
jgi:uncharacterized membrane protein SpoIIM required for sporulation